MNYTVTSNHIHLLVKDDGEREVIPQSIKLIAGRTGQEYNIRKNRKGAFWEDRYHATAVEGRRHLLRCLVYIDLNMVRNGVVNHPAKWPFCGYDEIQAPKRKYRLIAHDRLAELAGYDSHDSFRQAHRELVEESLFTKTRQREPEWTESIAVGSKGFIESIKKKFGALARGRKMIGENKEFQLRELLNPIIHFLQSKRRV